MSPDDAIPAGLRRTRVEPPRGWIALNLAEIWAFRDLLVMLALRDVKLRYSQTAIGVAWVVLQPLLASVIFTVIFGYLAALPSDGVPYFVFVYCGLVPWSLFSGALQRAGSSLIVDASLITKVYFPRMIIPIAAAGAVLVDALVALAVLIVLLVLYGSAVGVGPLAVPALILLVLVNGVGVSLWLAAANAYYRDFMHATPFLVQLWMYASPIVYSVGMIPEAWRPLFALNPMVGAIAGFRWALLGTPLDLPALAISTVVGCVVLLSGAAVFRRVENSLADVV